ncbi:integral membrane protein GPR180-like [Halichondria panicea]|uniref:integral membrane protein GPR180-like n=1 Tax=Halichondria panicea TaxID=6063 RepID=UPI00312B3A76
MQLALSCTNLLLLVHLPFCLCKVIQGTVSSLEAWEQSGQFVTKFCFHDKKALFRYSTNATSAGSWYFILDESWPFYLAEQDCHKRLAMSKFEVKVSKTEEQQVVNQWMRPHFWFLVYGEPSTCNTTTPTSNAVLEYRMEFLNPDSSGVANDHFGDDYRGLLPFYAVLVLAYIAGIGLYAHRVWLTISKGGPMHEVLNMLSVAMALHMLAAILMLIHLWRYSVNGRGIPLFETLSEASEMLSQCTMVWLLLSLSVGWTMGSNTTSPLKDTKQLSLITAIALTHVILVLWEQTYDESHYTFHIHESLPGFLLVMLRFGLVGLLTYNLQRTLANERSVLRREFYSGFAIGCYLWFLAFPMLMLLAVPFASYLRHKVVTVGVTLIQAVSMGLLSRLFLSRSLYWEVSTLSSSTLPLRRDMGGGPGFLTRLS